MFPELDKLIGKSSIKVLAYGWYRKGNVGDDLFEDAFHKLFPEFEFIFTDEITEGLLSETDAVFFGGGSFLFSAPLIDVNLLPKLKEKKIFYIGMGAETDIHQIHQDLIKIAKLVCIRSNDLEKISKLNSNVMLIPDLVYFLQDSSLIKESEGKTVLIFPNISVVPSYKDKYWRHTSWLYFKSEFAQSLENIINTGWDIKFLSMCNNSKQNDAWAAHEIINHLDSRDRATVVPTGNNFAEIATEVSKHKIIITQRFHGIILSQLLRKPCVSIFHHDKLKICSTKEIESIPYYGINKDELLNRFYQLSQVNLSDNLSIDSNAFVVMQEKVRALLQNG